MGLARRLLQIVVGFNTEGREREQTLTLNLTIDPLQEPLNPLLSLPVISQSRI